MQKLIWIRGSELNQDLFISINENESQFVRPGLKYVFTIAIDLKMGLMGPKF